MKMLRTANACGANRVECLFFMKILTLSDPTWRPQSVGGSSQFPSHRRAFHLCGKCRETKPPAHPDRLSPTSPTDKWFETSHSQSPSYTPRHALSSAMAISMQTYCQAAAPCIRCIRRDDQIAAVTRFGVS